jgi:hypothetical protein
MYRLETSKDIYNEILIYAYKADSRGDIYK